MIKEHSQVIKDRNWWKCGIQNICGFFYILVWDDPIIPNKKILKFGYKLSAIAYKKNYAEPPYSLPLSSDIWMIIRNPNTKKNASYWREKGDFNTFIIRKESQINRTLKNHKKFNRCNKSREYYHKFDYNFAINSIRDHLYDFNHEFEKYQKETDQKIFRIIR